MKFLVAALLCALTLGSRAEAASLTITVDQVGADIVMTASGSIDLTGATLLNPGQFFNNTSINDAGSLLASTGLVDIYDFGSFDQTPVLSGTGATFLTFVKTGDNFGVSAVDLVLLPAGYTSLDPINFVMTRTGPTVADAGFTFGTFATFGDNTIRIVDGAAVVPLPAPLALLGAGVLALGLVGRRRRA